MHLNIIISIFWRSIQAFGQQGITFIVSLILARLLDKEAFGTVAVVNFIIGLALTFMDGELGSALVFKEKIDSKDINTVFIFNSAVGFLFAILLFLASPLIADFYQTPVLKWLIRFVSLKIVISSFGVVQKARLTRQMKFGTLAIVQLVSCSAGGAIAVYLALKGYGVWSIAWQYLLTVFLTTLLYWMIEPWIPDFHFYRDRFLYLFEWGFCSVVAQFIASLGKNGHSAISGKVVGMSTAGIFSRAESLESMPRQSITTIFSDVAAPVFYRNQKDNKKLCDTLDDFMHLAFCVMLPLSAWMLIHANRIVLVLLGKQWNDVTPFFRLLVILGLFYIFDNYVSLIFRTKNKVFQLIIYEFVKRCLTLLVALCAVLISVNSMLYAEIILWFVIIAIDMVILYRMIDYQFLRLLKTYLPLVCAALCSAIIDYFMRNLFVQPSEKLVSVMKISLGSFLDLPNFFHVMFSFVAAVIVFLVLMFIFQLKERKYIVSFFQHIGSFFLRKRGKASL